MNRIIALSVLMASCTAPTPDQHMGEGVDVGSSNDAPIDMTPTGWILPAPEHAHDEYVSLAEEQCGNAVPDRSKIVFAFQYSGGHVSGFQLNWRNGTPMFLLINEACEMWIQAFGIADSFLAMPVYKRLSIDEMAHILEKYRVLELPYFDNTSTTLTYNSGYASYMYLTFRDRTYAFDNAYSGVFGPDGEVDPGLKFADFEDIEIMAIAVLKESFWEDPAVWADTQPYVGDRLWINVLPQSQVTSPERLLQNWPLGQSAEDLGWVFDDGCSDHFVALEGDEAVAFRQARSRVLSEEPADSKGHFAVPMISGEHRYWVEMSEGLPPEDEFGYITFRGERVYYKPCEF